MQDDELGTTAFDEEDDLEDDELDEAQFSAWVKQAAALPGEKM